VGRFRFGYFSNLDCRDRAMRRCSSGMKALVSLRRLRRRSKTVACRRTAIARSSALVALSLGQGIPTAAALRLGAGGGLVHPNRGASAPSTVALVPAADELGN
jgi:hypothetical protein